MAEYYSIKLANLYGSFYKDSFDVVDRILLAAEAAKLLNEANLIASSLAHYHPPAKKVPFY